jgi:hypothetical protein
MTRSGKTGLHKLKQDISTFLRLLLMTLDKFIFINSVQLYNVRLLNYITYSGYNSPIISSHIWLATPCQLPILFCMHFNLLYLVVFVVLLNLVRYLTHLPMFIKSLCFHFQVLLGAGPVTGIIIPERVVLEHTQKLWGSASLYSPGARLHSSPALAAPRAPSPARCPPVVRSTPLLKLVIRPTVVWRRGRHIVVLYPDFYD